MRLLALHQICGGACHLGKNLPATPARELAPVPVYRGLFILRIGLLPRDLDAPVREAAFLWFFVFPAWTAGMGEYIRRLGNFAGLLCCGVTETTGFIGRVGVLGLSRRWILTLLFTNKS